MIEKSSTILVTGGAGFIGSNLVRHLNNKGYENIIIVDLFKDTRKLVNIKNLKWAGFLDLNKKDILNFVETERDLINSCNYVFHCGAISSTTHEDGHELVNYNLLFSLDLINFCYNRGIPIQYASSASVYGNGDGPLNGYAASKKFIDYAVEGSIPNIRESDIFGLRYFNVYGPGESHKDGQSSPIFQFCKQLDEFGKIKLFNVQAERDFIHVDDVCKFQIWLMENNVLPGGIYDLGTGISTSFERIANLVIKNYYKDYHKPLELLIELVEFPQKLYGKYQYFTKANLQPISAYNQTMLTIEEGVRQYVQHLREEKEKLFSHHVKIDFNKR